MWTKKYRPKTFDEIAGNKDIINSIEALTQGDLPHLLLIGPPGTGKTTAAEVVIRVTNAESLELNASDERGIAVIQNKVKEFAKTQSFGNRLKIVLLDEADALTDDAMTALRRVMEQYQSTCRFILTCNFPKKLIEPLKSRCIGGTFEFKPVSAEDAFEFVKRICKEEDITITEAAFYELYNRNKGDMRIVDKIYGLSLLTKDITVEDVIKFKDDDTYLKIIELLKSGKYTDICKIIEEHHVIQIFQYVMDSDIEDDKKQKIVEAIAEWDYRMQFSITDYVQLYKLVSDLKDILSGKKEVKSFADTVKKYK